ncbi:MAG: sulfotransferase [Caldilineaceae bacterium]
MINITPFSNQADRPIFVVGAPRSGTTLTGTILGRHATIFAPGESHFFEDIWTRQQQYGKLRSNAEISAAVERVTTLFGRYNFPETQALVDKRVAAPALVDAVQLQGGGYAALFKNFMATLAAHPQKMRICDDTPKHLFHVDAILQLFPQAKIIACVRDPRDFLSSYKYYWRKSTESERIKALYHPILTSLLWRTSAKLLLTYTNRYEPGQFCWIRYEDLVQSPQQTIRRLCAFVEIDYADDLFAIESNNSSFGSTEVGIFSSSVGRWRSELHPEEIWWAQRLAGPQMQALGYKQQAAAPSPLRVVAQGAALPWPCSVRCTPTKKRGPLGPYLWRRTLAMVGG